MSNLSTLGPSFAVRDSRLVRPHAPNNKKHPNGYLVPRLKRLLSKKISYYSPENPEVKIEGTVRDALLWRLILNGCEGETAAIKEIIEKVDGKILPVHEGANVDLKIVLVNKIDLAERVEALRNVV